MENWLILTLLVTVSIGIVAFINKVFAERKYNVQFSALVLYGIMFCISIILGYFQGFVSLASIGTENIFWCILWGIQFYGYSYVMMSALRYLPTSTYFITVRLSSSFILLFIGILFFGDIVSFKEIFGFILGVIAMSLLFENEGKKIDNLTKGIFFLCLGIAFLVFGHTITKVLSLDLVQVPTLLVIAFGSAFLTSLIFGYQHIGKNIQYFKGIFSMNLIQSLFFFIYFYFLFQVYNLGDLGISYKIQSYSPFIPIILAALIYRDKITHKKMIGIIITAISLYFFA